MQSTLITLGTKYLSTILLVKNEFPPYIVKYVAQMYEGDTPPFLVRSIQGVLRRYAIRKGSVRSTQNPVISYADIIFLLLNGPIFIKRQNKSDIQSQITLKNFARALRSRFLGSI